MSAMSLNSVATNSYSSNPTYNPSYANSNSNLLPHKGPVAPFEVIKEGMAKTKEDGLMKFWSDKWLVLRDAQLDFHKAQNSQKINFQISLKDVTNVSRSENYPFSFEISRVANPGVTSPGGARADVAVKTVICRVETDDEVYDWIDSIYARVPGMGGVSRPTDFNHTVHVGFDQSSGAFTGLPVEWARLLNASAITKEDYSRNPAAVIEVLNFYTEKLQKGDDGGMTYPAITPPVPMSMQGMNEKQLGYGQVAPPRPKPPNDYIPRSGSPATTQYNEKSPAVQQTYHQLSGQKSYKDLRSEQEAANRMQVNQQQQQQQQQQQRYGENLSNTPRGPNAQAPQVKSSGPKYNPQRAPPAPPGIPRQQAQLQQQQPPTTAQRQAPPAPVYRAGSDPAMPGRSSPALPSPQRQESPRQQANQNQLNGYAPAPPKPSFPVNPQAAQARQKPAANAQPLNVSIAQATGAAAVAELAQKAEQAPLKAPPAPAQAQQQQQAQSQQQNPQPRTRDQQRMSTMTEAEVMKKLREVVSKDPPLQSYNKQKKIGQGASGSVYVARVRESATSMMARQVLKQQGPRAQVAIKQMDLRHQQRKELIVNEIVVMKDSKHPNIVNFIEAFLPEEQTELWVVMEFMEGGALTDVIENNPSITEDQIATICFEVSSRYSYHHIAASSVPKTMCFESSTNNCFHSDMQGPPPPPPTKHHPSRHQIRQRPPLLHRRRQNHRLWFLR